MAAFRELCAISVPGDGLVFDSESAQADRIKADQEYEGVRVKMICHLDAARIPLQIDIGFGDAVTPPPTLLDYPAILEFPAPRLWAYPRETVVSEKLEAMIHLGMSNSRIKDFFDLWFLSRNFAFEEALLAAAIRATFARRQTSANPDDFVTLLAQLAADSGKEIQWKAFLRNRKIPNAEDWPQVLSDLKEFLLPPLTAMQADS